MARIELVSKTGLFRIKSVNGIAKLWAFEVTSQNDVYCVRTVPAPPPPPPSPSPTRWPPRRRGRLGCHLTARWPYGGREQAVEVAHR